MGERPLLAYSVADLEAMTRTAWDDPGRLRLLASELRQRATPQALALRERVEERLKTKARVPPGEDLVSLLLEIETLKVRLDAAQREIAAQKRLIEGLKAEGRDPDDPHARVFVHPEIPDFALRALRAAFRKQYHPDGRPEHERAAAREAFLRHEALFDAIERLRARAA